MTTPFNDRKIRFLGFHFNFHCCFNFILSILALAILFATGPRAHAAFEGGTGGGGLTLLNLSRDGAGKVLIEMGEITDAYFVLYRGPSPFNLATPIDAQLPQGRSTTLTDLFSPAESAFYRIEAVPFSSPGDLDLDGLDDLTELRNRPLTNPLKADLDPDRDGISNADEIRSRTNPLVADPPATSRLPLPIRTAAGRNHVLAIRQDGSLWAWGEDDSGQLGLGRRYFMTPTQIMTNQPTQVGRGTWKTVGAGRSHSLGVMSDGSLWGWGDNTFSQLGIVGIRETNQPVRIGVDTDWIAVAGGDEHSVALKRDGTVWTWGTNDRGQLGDGTAATSLVPHKVPFNGATCMMIASGDYQVVALRTDNTLWGWGANDHGVLGIGLPPGVFKSMRAPFEVGGKKKWVSVASGYHHMLALRDDLTLWSWGENLAGQLGNGTTTDALVPTAVGTTQVWKSIACGAYHSLAIRNDGTLWTWGLSDHGELGLGKYGFKKTPTQAGAADLWTQVQGGLAFSIMVRADGSLWSAGNNEFGQLGNTTVPFGFGDTNNSPKMVRIGQVTSW